MPLETTHRITCSAPSLGLGCGATAEEIRKPVPNQTTPAFVVPDGWTEPAHDEHLCPECSAVKPVITFSKESFVVTNSASSLSTLSSPDTLIFGNGGEPLVTIKRDGDVVIAEGFTPSDAAKAFWDAVRDMGLRP